MPSGGPERGLFFYGNFFPNTFPPLIEFEDHAREAEKAVIRIVRALQVRAPGLVNVTAVLHAANILALVSRDSSAGGVPAD